MLLESSSLSIGEMISFQPLNFESKEHHRSLGTSPRHSGEASKLSAQKGFGLSFASFDKSGPLESKSPRSKKEVVLIGPTPVVKKSSVEGADSAKRPRKKSNHRASLLSFSTMTSRTLLETIHDAVGTSIAGTARPSVSLSFELATFAEESRRASRSMASKDLDQLMSRRMTTATKDILAMTFRNDPTGGLSNLAVLKIGQANFREHTVQLLQERDAALAQWKELADNRRQIERTAMWSTVLRVLHFSKCAHKSFLKAKHQFELQRQFYPYLLRMMRRFARRIRLKLNAPLIRLPLLSQVRADKTLALFNDAHLIHFISTLQLRYYFPQEVIVYKDVVEDEAFVLAVGKANVVVKGVVVFTMNPGACFGTAGMVSGEPRSATVVSVDGCYAFAGSRKDFEAFGDVTSEVAAAHALLDDMRRRNLKHVYQPLLSPQALYHMSTFKDVEESALQQLVAAGVSEAVAPGTVMYSCAKPARQKDVSSILLLRGTVRILKNLKRPNPAGKSNREICLQVVDCGVHSELIFYDPVDALPGGAAVKAPVLPHRSDGGPAHEVLLPTFQEAQPVSSEVDAQRRRSLAAQAKRDSAITTIIDGEEHAALAECSAPCLLRFTEALFFDWYYIAIQAIHPCDFVRFSHDSIIALDIVAIHQLRENCNLRQISHVVPPPRQIVLGAIFPGKLAFDFLRTVKLQKLTFEPLIIGAGEDMHFTGTIGYIVQSGTLSSANDQQEGGYPFLWPPISTLYFGCESVHTRAKSRAEVLRFSRAELVGLLRASLSVQKLETLEDTLHCDFTKVFRKRAAFVPIMTDAKTLADEESEAPPADALQKRTSFMMQQDRMRLGTGRPVREETTRQGQFPPGLAHLHVQQPQVQAQAAALQKSLFQQLHPPLLQHPLRRPEAVVAAGIDHAILSKKDGLLHLPRRPPLPPEARPTPRPTTGASQGNAEDDDPLALDPNQKLFLDLYKSATSARNRGNHGSGLVQTEAEDDSIFDDSSSSYTRASRPSSSIGVAAGHHPTRGRTGGLERTAVLASSIPRTAPLSLPMCHVAPVAPNVGRAGITQQDVDRLTQLEMMLRKACLS